MSMYGALNACKGVIDAISSGGPEVCQITVQQHEDERPNNRAANWMNLTPGSVERTNETGRSYQTQYTIIGSLWIVKNARLGQAAITSTASTLWETVWKALCTTWGGFARITVTPADISEEWESGDDGDIAYVIRSEIKVTTQEAIT